MLDGLPMYYFEPPMCYEVSPINKGVHVRVWIGRQPVILSRQRVMRCRRRIRGYLIGVGRVANMLFCVANVLWSFANVRGGPCQVLDGSPTCYFGPPMCYEVSPIHKGVHVRVWIGRQPVILNRQCVMRCRRLIRGYLIGVGRVANMLFCVANVLWSVANVRGGPCQVLDGSPMCYFGPPTCYEVSPIYKGVHVRLWAGRQSIKRYSFSFGLVAKVLLRVANV